MLELLKVDKDVYKVTGTNAFIMKQTKCTRKYKTHTATWVIAIGDIWRTAVKSPVCGFNSAREARNYLIKNPVWSMEDGVIFN